MPNQSVNEVPESETRLQVIMLDALPAADGAGLIEIPIAVIGQWKRGEQEFAITSADLQHMAANFSKRKNGEINIDYDHASEMPEVARGGPIPSAGRIVKLRSNGALHALIEFTARALELIRNREYRFVSPAIHYQAQNKATGEIQGTTLTSLAPTNRPFLEELPAIKLSEISVGPGPARFKSSRFPSGPTPMRRGYGTSYADCGKGSPSKHQDQDERGWDFIRRSVAASQQGKARAGSRISIGSLRIPGRLWSAQRGGE